ncbi:MAG: hypothetical protein L0Y72_02500 [Gemmataceae bacterium]|nr:hypothetical protein [Gemmataceae bacterium]MCI0737887.1 hypothetical protein [Gemmataceae bacterium]
MEELYGRYKDKAEFVCVYLREAHPADGWAAAFNKDVCADITQPRNYEERAQVAERCCAHLKITMPLVVDAMDDRVGHAYSGMPDRLYIIDAAGRVAYKGGRGPSGFKSGEMEQSLLMLLIDEAAQARPALRQGRSRQCRAAGTTGADFSMSLRSAKRSAQRLGRQQLRRQL